MAVETRSRGKGSAPNNGKANGKPKVDDSKKRKAPEEPVVEKSKKIRQAKGDKEAPAASTDATAAVPAKPTTAPAKSPKNKKKAKKAAVAVEEPEVEEEIPEPTPAESEDAAGSENDEAEEEEDNTAVEELAAEIDGDDEDDAAQDAISQFETGQDVGKIPKTSFKKAKKTVQYEGKPGVVYVGRVPHGFYEHEMRQYFSQFGDITQLRLSRNKKTGASKHFAFIQFAEEATAAVVAKTMNSYLLFGHILKCQVVPPERIHKDLWKGANRRFKQVPWNKMVGKELGRPVSQSGWERRVKKEERRRVIKAEKLKEIGYEFEAPTLKAIPAPAPVEEAPAKVDGAEVAEPAQAETNGAEALPEPVAEAKVEAEKVEEPVEAEKIAEPAPVVKATKGKKKGPKAKAAKAKA